MYSTSTASSSLMTEPPARRFFAPTWSFGRPTWPESEKSTGRELEPLDRRHRCWEIFGPVLELEKRLDLLKQIKDVLDSRNEYLVEGERIVTSLHFGLYMTGRRKEEANPLLLFNCSRPNPRKRAKQLIKESRLLADYPTIRLADSERPPQAPRPFRMLVGGKSSRDKMSEPVNKNVYFSLVDYNSSYTCGIQAFIPREDGTLRKATIGGMVMLSDRCFGLTVAHAFRDTDSPLHEEEDIYSDMDCDFDSDSDSGGQTRDRYARDRQRQVNPEEGLIRRTPVGQPRAPLPLGEPNYQSRFHEDFEEAQGQASNSWFNRRPSGQLFESSLDSDWALVKMAHIDNISAAERQSHPYNMIQFVDKRHGGRGLRPSTIVTTGAKDRNVLAVTGDKGVIRGRLSPSSIYLRTGYTRGFQELWTVYMNRSLVEGDCGSWVIDELDGTLYGHIVAGHPPTGVGYIVPAFQIFESIWQTLGDAPTLPTSAVLSVADMHMANLKTPELTWRGKEKQDWEKVNLPSRDVEPFTRNEDPTAYSAFDPQKKQAESESRDRKSASGKPKTASSGDTFPKDLNDKAIARVLQRNERDSLKSDQIYPPSIERERPTWTRMAQEHIAIETLEAFNIDYQLVQDPEYVLIRRWVPEDEQEYLFQHTRKLRSGKSSPFMRRGSPGLLPIPINRVSSLADERRSKDERERFHPIHVAQSQAIVREHPPRRDKSYYRPEEEAGLLPRRTYFPYGSGEDVMYSVPLRPRSASPRSRDKSYATRPTKPGRRSSSSSFDSIRRRSRRKSSVSILRTPPPERSDTPFNSRSVGSNASISEPPRVEPLLQPLPLHWAVHQYPSGEEYHVPVPTGTSQWDPPTGSSAVTYDAAAFSGYHPPAETGGASGYPSHPVSSGTTYAPSPLSPQLGPESGAMGSSSKDAGTDKKNSGADKAPSKSSKQSEKPVKDRNMKYKDSESSSPKPKGKKGSGSSSLLTFLAGGKR